MKLSTNLKKYLYWFVSIASTFVIALSVYYYLGGFNDLEVVKSNNNIYNVAGREFRGRITSDSLNTIFNEVRDLVLENKINGELCVINYRENLEKNEVHQFIGILLGDEISEIPSGLKVREIKAETSFKVGLGMHPLVMPNTGKVEEVIHEFAQQNGFSLESYTMEIIFSDNSILVEMFAR